MPGARFSPGRWRVRGTLALHLGVRAEANQGTEVLRHIAKVNQTSVKLELGDDQSRRVGLGASVRDLVLGLGLREAQLAAAIAEDFPLQ